MRALPSVLVFACTLVALSGCDGSRDQLLANLQSVRPEERATAVRKLAEAGRPEDLVLFTRAAKDTAPIVRGEAAVALGKSQDARVVDLLGELLGDPDEQVQAKAAMALAQIKSEKAKSYLTLQYARRGRPTRYAIVEALKAANVPGAMAAVVAAESQTLWDRNLKALTDGSLPERVAAAEELGKSGRVEAVNRLLPLIKDSHVILAAAAVRGLGHAGDPRAVDPIGDLLKENFPELREAAIASLVRLGDPKALPRLKEVALEKSAVSALATQAISALPEGPQTAAALCELALSGSAEEASIAARAMRLRGGCPLEPILERLGRRGEQAAALQALEGLGPVAAPATPRVLPLLASSDEALRVLAVAAVSELRDPSAGEAVRKVHDAELKRLELARAKWVPGPLPTRFAPGFDPAGEALVSGDDPTSGARLRQGDLFKKIRQANEAKMKATGKSATLRASPPVELVDDVSEEGVRTFAATLRALGAVQAPDALELLTPWATDPSPSLRSAACAGLALLGPRAHALVAEALLDPVREVQSAAAQALAEQGADGQRAVADLLPKLAADRIPLLLALDRAGPDPVVGAALAAVLRDGSAESALAAQLLGRLRHSDAVPLLIRILEDPNAIARRDVIAALGRIGDPRAAELVARELNHDSPDVRAAAAEALAHLGTNPRADALDALKGDYYRRVRESADAALSGPGGAATAAQE
jgi:HEAT repeat protein